MLSSADAFRNAAGDRIVTGSGAFNFEDLIQISFPAAGLMVVQGNRFAAYDVTGQAVAGESSRVANGVSRSDLPEVLDDGEPAGPPARLTQLNRDVVSVVLPASFVAGAASVLLYAEHDGEYFVSNAIAVTLP
jgi:hypothetical protein